MPAAVKGAGHWLLETHFDSALPLVRDFLTRVHGSAQGFEEVQKEKDR
ncbi:hypothetical protein [Mesorhizobium sp. CO1-1-11]